MKTNCEGFLNYIKGKEDDIFYEKLCLSIVYEKRMNYISVIINMHKLNWDHSYTVRVKQLAKEYYGEFFIFEVIDLDLKVESFIIRYFNLPCDWFSIMRKVKYNNLPKPSEIITRDGTTIRYYSLEKTKEFFRKNKHVFKIDINKYRKQCVLIQKIKAKNKKNKCKNCVYLLNTIDSLKKNLEMERERSAFFNELLRK